MAAWGGRYDYLDDNSTAMPYSPATTEDNFGTVRLGSGEALPHAPKPAYRAAAAAQRLLGGRPFAGRLNVSGAPAGVPSYALRFGPAVPAISPAR